MMDLLTEKELASRLRCSQAAIRVWRKQGLPTLRFGRLVRFEWGSALRWFKAKQEKEPSAK